MKVCAFCGKQEGKNWANHCKVRHNGSKKEWDGLSDLIEIAWCENWKEIAVAVEPKPKPVNIHPSFKPGFQAGNKLHEMRSKIGSVSDSSSVYQETVYNESQFAPEEGIQIQKEAAKSEIQISQEEVKEGIQIQKEAAKSEIQISQEEVKKNFTLPNPNPPANSKSTTVSLLGKRSGMIDEPTEQEVRQSLDKVEAMFSSDSTPFEKPFPLVQTVYLNQGMRDQQAIQKLRVLEKKTAGSLQQRVFELIGLTSMFAQPIVSTFIEMHKTDLTQVKSLLIIAQGWTDEISPDEMTAVAFASVLFGGSAWASLPKMFGSLDSSNLKEVLCLLSPLLALKFNEDLARWFCTSW